MVMMVMVMMMMVKSCSFDEGSLSLRPAQTDPDVLTDGVKKLDHSCAPKEM